MKKTRQINQLERTIKDYGFEMILLKDSDEVKEYTFIKDKRKIKKTIEETFDFAIAALGRIKEQFPELKKFDIDFQLLKAMKEEFLKNGEFEILEFNASVTIQGELHFPIEVKVGPGLTNEDKKELILAEAYHKASEVFQNYFSLEDTGGFQINIDDYYNMQDWTNAETKITISDKSTSDIIYNEEFGEE